MTLLVPPVEELLFRGLLVAVPVALGASFWPIAIASGMLFGATHVPWDDSLTGDHLWTFLVTGGGGVWYARLLRHLTWNLWATIFLHALMNGAWSLFGIGGGAVGSGIGPNIGRGLTLAVGTVLALRAQRRRESGAT